MRLTNVLSEILNTFQVEADIISDRSFSITSILNQIRGLYKVTIVNNITPENYPQKDKVDFTRVKIKFVTRTDPKQDIENFRKDILISNLDKNDLRIPGVKSIKFKPETIKRI